MKAKNTYLAVDLDREIFKDEQGKEYTTEQVKELIKNNPFEDGNGINLTLMANRLVYQFNYDFAAIREFYKSNY